MRHGHFVSLLCVVGLVTAAGANAAPGAPPGQGTLQVGADSRTVLPLVDGSHDYLKAGFPERGNAFDPGIPVPKWDDGRIAVGNGEPESYWVHDDIRVTALAIDDPRSPHIVVIVATDLYMVFRNDGEEIRARAAKLLPPGIAKKLKVVVTASHNHHGPDTAFDVNHGWYDYMAGQAAATVAAAVKSRRPARLQVASGEHWFGMNDGTDPNIYDPRLNVLQAIDTRGQVIATTVQWNLHPEATLGWPPPLAEIEDDCPMLGLTGSNCNAEGRYFTSDFVGCPARGPGRSLRRRSGVPQRRARRADRPGWVGCLGGHQRPPAGQPAEGAGRRRGAGWRRQLHATQLPPGRGHRGATRAGGESAARRRREDRRAARFVFGAAVLYLPQQHGLPRTC